MKHHLKSVGEALYGRSWKAQTAALLKVDRRRINHWLEGTRPIPEGIWAELQEEAILRKARLEESISLLAK